MLELDRAEMQALGYRVVDLLVDHWATLREQPAGRRTDPAALAALLQEPPPEEGRDPAAVLDRLERDVLAHMGRVHHPRFFAFVPSPSNFVSVLGDAIAAGTNVFAGTWLESSGPAMLELVTVDWLRRLCGMEEPAGGLFVSGGSVANLTALAVARRAVLADAIEGAVVYGSDQTHSAVDRALAVLGFAPSQLRKLPSDSEFRLPVAALESAVAEDRAAGRRPFCVVASAGTTNTGAVDPLDELADFCARQGLWIHVDAAYGGAAVLCERGRVALAGLGRADSLALDPHKWLFQPYEIGCILVRDRRLLPETFHIRPDYLRDVHPQAEEINFADYGIQLTRSFRALKLWLSIQIFGLGAFREAVARGFSNGERAEALLRGSGTWDVVTPAGLGIVTFRYAPPGASAAAADAVTGRLAAAALADGFMMVSSTTLRGRLALRLCAINPRTTEEDLRASIERLESLAGRLLAEVSESPTRNPAGKGIPPAAGHHPASEID
ncbi:MAG TPA: aminotransferase class I/II-fold pyridoxal phosphate-dependent enzyme [Gemmatimonadota bacterium]|nr:aminotransferase class I/II-fold pyridoxal phosphate-dependent enzyme [Gemmatimonadota bacterium]